MVYKMPQNFDLDTFLGGFVCICLFNGLTSDILEGLLFSVTVFNSIVICKTLTASAKKIGPKMTTARTASSQCHHSQSVVSGKQLKWNTFYLLFCPAKHPLFV